MVHDLLTEAMGAGIVLGANGDRLTFDAPAGAMTPDLRRRLVEHKAQVLAILRTAAEPPRSIRQRVAELIRQARRRRPDVARALRDAWRERVAICTIDGRLTQGRAELVAIGELRTLGEGGENPPHRKAP